MGANEHLVLVCQGDTDQGGRLRAIRSFARVCENSFILYVLSCPVLYGEISMMDETVLDGDQHGLGLCNAKRHQGYLILAVTCNEDPGKF